MADNLTVKSRPDAPAAPTPAPASRTDDKAAAELQALRTLVRNRTGREVADPVLEQLRDKRHARLSQAAKLVETKAAFESAAGKETLGSATGARDVQARRAVGAAEAKGADRLSEKDRTDVRGNLEAGPCLPPTMAKAATPEQATALVERIFENLLLDGQTLDPRTYADSVRERPSAPAARASTRGSAPAKTSGETAPGAPSTPDATPATAVRPDTARPGRPTAAPTTSGRPVSLPAPRPASLPGATASAPSPASAAPREAGPAKLPTTAPARPTSVAPGPRPGGPTGVARPAPGLPGGSPAPALSLSLKLGGSARPTSRAGADEVSASGGGLESTTSFDGLHFNWDAYLMRFMISSAEDMALWRKMLREMRDLAGKATMMAIDADIERTEMQHEVEVLQAGAELIKGILDLGKAWKAGEMDAMVGKNGRRMATDHKDLRSWMAAHGRPGRTLLGKSEVAALPPEQRAAYEHLVERLQGSAGRIGMAALLRAELTLDEGTLGGAAREELEQLATACESEARRTITGRSGDREMMQRLREGLSELREGYKDRDAEAAKKPADSTAATGDRLVALSSLAALDDELFRLFCGSTKDFLGAEAKKLPAGEARTRLEQAAAGTMPPPDRAATIERLTARTAAGEHLLAAVDVPADSAAARLGKRAEKAVDDFATSLDKDGWAGHLAAVVNEAAQRAQASARERRVELDQIIQQATREAQGMLNQLLVTGLHRT